MAKKDYEVGYKCPPKATQFKPGQSGNPKGRPGGVKNLSTDLQEELESTIVISENNQQREITKQRAVIKTMFAKAMKGDIRASSTLLQSNQETQTESRRRRFSHFGNLSGKLIIEAQA